MPHPTQPRVAVLDRNGKPLMPCHPARARELLRKGRARVHQLIPYAIRLVDRTLENSVIQPIDMLIDPGSKGTGLTLCRAAETIDQPTGEVITSRHAIVLTELVHRGAAIRKAMKQRAGYRGRRRSVNLPYRKPRFDNRTRKDGWLPPSLKHRVDTVVLHAGRWARLVPIRAVHVEAVSFDMQALENPDISGEEYQNGTLAGWELWQYLLDRDNRTCVYCDAVDVPLEREHISPRATGGSNRVSNLACSCRKCNKRKADRPVEEFLADDPDRLARIKARLKTPLNDAAAVNSTRKALTKALSDRGFDVHGWSGGRTKWNRTRMGVPKAHALDALCVGRVDAAHGWNMSVLRIDCTGRGRYRRTNPDDHGFPRGGPPDERAVFGFRTGDMVKATVLKGKKTGVHTGRVAVRSSGYFNIGSGASKVQGISWKACRLLQHADGYGYTTVCLSDTLQASGGLAIKLESANTRRHSFPA